MKEWSVCATKMYGNTYTGKSCMLMFIKFQINGSLASGILDILTIDKVNGWNLWHYLELCEIVTKPDEKIVIKTRSWDIYLSWNFVIYLKRVTFRNEWFPMKHSFFWKSWKNGQFNEKYFRLKDSIGL